MRAAVAVVLLALAAAVAWVVLWHGPRLAREHSDIVRSKDNIRSLLILHVARGTQASDGPRPRLHGKNFILSLVATDALDRRNPKDLDMLWPPSMPGLEALDIAAYDAVTLDSLRTRRFPHLTGYAGPRQGVDPHAVTAKQEGQGTPLIADLTLSGGIIIGWSNGTVTYLELDEGEPTHPDGRLVVGPQAKNDVLRMLSDE